MKEKITENHFYVFVNLNGDKMTEPDYFICTGLEAINNVKQYTTRGIIELSCLNNTDFKSRWDKIK